MCSRRDGNVGGGYKEVEKKQTHVWIKGQIVASKLNPFASEFRPMSVRRAENSCQPYKKIYDFECIPMRERIASAMAQTSAVNEMFEIGPGAASAAAGGGGAGSSSANNDNDFDFDDTAQGFDQMMRSRRWYRLTRYVPYAIRSNTKVTCADANGIDCEQMELVEFDNQRDYHYLRNDCYPTAEFLQSDFVGTSLMGDVNGCITKMGNAIGTAGGGNFLESMNISILPTTQAAAGFLPKPIKDKEIKVIYQRFFGNDGRGATGMMTTKIHNLTGEEVDLASLLTVNLAQNLALKDDLMSIEEATEGDINLTANNCNDDVDVNANANANGNGNVNGNVNNDVANANATDNNKKNGKQIKIKNVQENEKDKGRRSESENENERDNDNDENRNGDVNDSDNDYGSDISSETETGYDNDNNNDNSNDNDNDYDNDNGTGNDKCHSMDNDNNNNCSDNDKDKSNVYDNNNDNDNNDSNVQENDNINNNNDSVKDDNRFNHQENDGNIIKNNNMDNDNNNGNVVDDSNDNPNANVQNNVNDTQDYKENANNYNNIKINTNNDQNSSSTEQFNNNNVSKIAISNDNNNNNSYNNDNVNVNNTNNDNANQKNSDNKLINVYTNDDQNDNDNDSSNDNDNDNDNDKDNNSGRSKENVKALVPRKRVPTLQLIWDGILFDMFSNERVANIRNNFLTTTRTCTQVSLPAETQTTWQIKKSSSTHSMCIAHVSSEFAGIDEHANFKSFSINCAHDSQLNDGNAMEILHIEQNTERSSAHVVVKNCVLDYADGKMEIRLRPSQEDDESKKPGARTSTLATVTFKGLPPVFPNLHDLVITIKPESSSISRSHIEDDSRDSSRHGSSFELPRDNTASLLRKQRAQSILNKNDAEVKTKHNSANRQLNRHH